MNAGTGGQEWKHTTLMDIRLESWAQVTHAVDDTSSRDLHSQHEVQQRERSALHHDADAGPHQP